jgi:4-amino-4-deoxy-L-arabinose transferase-like glycosyltransferase
VIRPNDGQGASVKVLNSAINSRHLWTLLAIVLAIRLLAMALFPVMDTTESRYAEIARLTMVSGDWLVPQFSPGVPFWGKPPLFAWLTAGSFTLLGVGELAARLPHFLLALATLWLVALAARNEMPRERTLLALLVLASTPLFFASSGTVMTESGLLFSTTLCMAAFWRWTVNGDRRWALALFAGLGLGMLAKGPVALAMTALPLALWATANGRWRQLLGLPWLNGLALFLLVAAPWYVAAERHSPGFLEYFLVGEHFLRFVQPGWAGDLYGNAHQEPPGMIWLFWFQATGAWGVLMAVVAARFAARRLRAKTRPWPELDPWRSYLAWWMLAPLLFFTFSGNVLWTYVISGLPAFALILSNGGKEQ